MTEVLHVAVRVGGVAGPALLLLGVSELQGGAPAGDLGTYLEVLWVTALLSGAWAAADAHGTGLARTAVRWAAVAVLVGVVEGAVATVPWAGSAPGVAETVWLLVFHSVFPLAGAALGLGVAANVRPVSQSRPAPPRGRG